jgi:acyl-CoA oxidase
MRLGGVIRFLARRASSRLAASNPVAARNTDRAHLRDPAAHAFLLRYREERLLASVARRLKHRLDAGLDAFDAFSECQDHLLAVASAHVERLVATEFRAAIGEAPGPLQPVLTDLADLHVLSVLERDASWYLASGAMEGPKARAIRALRLELTATLSQSAEDLVNAFGIPDAVLAAPIAFTAAPVPMDERV